MIDRVSIPDILTLEETSEYLRLPVETVLNQALKGNIPGQKIEDHWRFLRAAIDDWLRSKNSRSVLLNQAGAFADDDSLAQLRDDIYHARGRSEIDVENWVD
jgi:excisionase family DNA binding protein